jgi:hypothetical protein
MGTALPCPGRLRRCELTLALIAQASIRAFITALALQAATVPAQEAPQTPAKASTRGTAHSVIQEAIGLARLSVSLQERAASAAAISQRCDPMRADGG